MSIENITVFTDASHCPQTKAAGGAFWARGDGDLRLQRAFALIAPDSNSAEILAACTAIQELAGENEFARRLERGRSTRLVLVVDCLGVKQALEGHTASMDIPEVGRVVIDVLDQLDQWDCWLKINHVPAHKGIGTPRNWVNTWCDREAKRHMRRQRDKLLYPNAINCKETL